MVTKIIKILVIVATFTVSIWVLMYSVEEISTLYNWSVSGSMRTIFSWNEDSSAILVNRVDTTDFLTSIYPDSGDIVVVGEDTTVGFMSELRKIRKGQPPGTKLDFQFVQDQDTISATVMTSKQDKLDIYSNIFIDILRFLGVLGFLGVGIWAFIKRPNSSAIHALTMFCVAMATFLTGAVTIGYDGIQGVEVPYLDKITTAVSSLAVFFGVFWLNLQILFPKPLKFVEKHLYISHGIIYFPQILLIVISFFAVTHTWGLFITFLIMAQVWAGFIILARNYSKSKDPLEKRQLRLVLWGSGVGLFGMFVLGILARAFRNWFSGLVGNVVL
jgi:hypothetical protein